MFVGHTLALTRLPDIHRIQPDPTTAYTDYAQKTHTHTRTFIHNDRRENTSVRERRQTLTPWGSLVLRLAEALSLLCILGKEQH